MTRPDTRALWNANAAAWTELSRAGFDRYRDLVNTPAFFGLLPQVDGLTCLDLGCGEGYNTRLLHSVALGDGGPHVGGGLAVSPGRAAYTPPRPVPQHGGNAPVQSVVLHSSGYSVLQ
jgi:hypothetical protein